MHLMEPARAEALQITQRNPAKVQALLQDFCAVLSHPSSAKATLSCPNNFGLYYDGTFYAGTRAVATFNYGASGCQTVGLTPFSPAGQPGKMESGVIMGAAAAAAPHLEGDMGKVLGIPPQQVYQPPAVHTNPLEPTGK